MGETSKIEVVGASLVIKHIRQDREYARRVFTTEVFWLRKLGKYECFPRLEGYSRDALYMDYCGEPINRENVPEDWQAQCIHILSMLKNNNCRHHDIKPAEILVNNAGKITLIDFGWAGPLDEPAPEDYYHLGVGAHYRPKSPKGNVYYDDVSQMRNALLEAIGERLSV